MRKCVPFAILFLIFCNKLPIGEDEIRTRGDFDAEFFDVSASAALTETKNIALGTSSNLIVGKNSDYESRILLTFGFDDTTYQGLDEIKLILKRNPRFKKDTVAFSVHLLTASYEESEATWYMRSNAEGWSIEGADYEEDSIRYAVISGDSVIVRFNYIELNNIQSAPGIIIIPRDTGFVGFYSREIGNAPQFQLVKNDVVTSIPIQADCHILTGPEPLYIETWIGSGMAYRNYVKFNIDLAGKKVVYAELLFRAAKHFSMRDSLEIGVKELTEPLDDYDTPTGSAIALEKFSVDYTLFTLDVVDHVQRVTDYPDSNFGIFIYLSPENYDIASFKIERFSYNVQIGYIEPPRDRW
jgi:hypothetical protein